MAAKPDPNRYESDGQRPEMWLRTAEDLRRAAKELHLERACRHTEGPGWAGEVIEITLVRLLPIEKMLFGLGFENLLKGIAVSSKPQVVSGGNLDKAMRTHDLPDLAAKASVTLTAEEGAVLRDLTEYVKWAGRYPIPTRWTSYDPDEYISEEERRNRDALWERIAALLKSLL
jgi:hypothetical protein